MVPTAILMRIGRDDASDVFKQFRLQLLLLVHCMFVYRNGISINLHVWGVLGGVETNLVFVAPLENLRKSLKTLEAIYKLAKTLKI